MCALISEYGRVKGSVLGFRDAAVYDSRVLCESNKGKCVMQHIYDVTQNNNFSYFSYNKWGKYVAGGNRLPPARDICLASHISASLRQILMKLRKRLFTKFGMINRFMEVVFFCLFV